MGLELGLELRRDSKQQLRSKWWYGRYQEEVKSFVKRCFPVAENRSFYRQISILSSGGRIHRINHRTFGAGE